MAEPVEATTVWPSDRVTVVSVARGSGVRPARRQDAAWQVFWIRAWRWRRRGDWRSPQPTDSIE